MELKISKHIYFSFSTYRIPLDECFKSIDPSEAFNTFPVIIPRLVYVIDISRIMFIPKRPTGHVMAE